jgi:hypothetical protein
VTEFSVSCVRGPGAPDIFHLQTLGSARGVLPVMRVDVSESYSSELPEDVEEDLDPQVSSYWMAGSDLVLQLSSYRRLEGPQIRAATLLGERLVREQRAATRQVSFRFASPDQACAAFVDEQGWEWLYAYLVWPDPCVFASVISTDMEESVLGSWAVRAIESIKREG